MITTTLNAIREYGPCTDGWRKLLAGLGKTQADDEPLPLVQILDINGLADTLWCLRTLGPDHQGWIRHYAVDCAESVAHLLTDERSREALCVARRYADGLATDAELAAASAAASAAAWDVALGAAWAVVRDAAWDAARDAAWAAAWAAELDAARDAASYAAWDAASAAAWDAASAAAWDAAWDAASAAACAAAWDAASAAAWDAASAAACAAARDWQTERLRAYLIAGGRPEGAV